MKSASVAHRHRWRRRRRRSLAVVFILALSCIVAPASSSFIAANNIRSRAAKPHHAAHPPIFSAPNGAATSLDTKPSPQEKKESECSNWQRGEYNSTLPSKLFYTYADPLLDIASERRLESSDAFIVPEQKLMARAVARLENAYQQVRDKVKATQHKNNRPKRKGKRKSESYILAMALLRSHKSTVMKTGILRLLNTVIQAFPALLIARLLRQIETGNTLKAIQPLKSALLLVSVLNAKMIIENQYFHHVVQCAGEVGGSIGGMIFDKSLRLSTSTGRENVSGETLNAKGDPEEEKKGSMGSGGVIQLVQSDAATISGVTWQLHTIWDGLLQLSIYTTLLYRCLGPSVIYGMAVLLSTIPINALTLRILNKLTRNELKAKDARIVKTTESITNMNLLKLQSWQDLFSNEIQNHRMEEMRRHRKRGAVKALNQAVSNSVPTITLVVTLLFYARSGRPMVASTIFTAISLFNQLRFPLFFYPMLIDSLANGQNALRRISEYLAQDEVADYVEYLPKGSEGRIEMRNGNFAWNAPPAASSNRFGEDGDEWQYKSDTRLNGRQPKKSNDVLPALCDASLSVGPGEVVAVVGEVGSGKTALVKSLIGELYPVPQSMIYKQSDPNSQGLTANRESAPTKVMTHGSIAYCAQEAWLPKGTIRESVVFGREYDEEKYLRAIYTAGLEDDVVDETEATSSRASTSQGLLTHETDVGEDGANLSGGQRARVALARALYDEDAGVYILDDPLSALDASVGATVFSRVVKELKKRNAATVFVTHDPNIPRRCDQVVLMGTSDNCSCITDIGPYDELISRGHDLRTIVHHEFGGHGEDDPSHNSVDYSHIQQSFSPSINNVTTSSGFADQIPLLNNLDTGEDSIVPSPSMGPREEKQLLSTDESMESGRVPRSTYAKYFKSVKSPLLIAAAFASFFLSNGSQFFQQLVVARWTEASTGGAISAAVSSKYLRQLVLAACAVSVSMFARSFLVMRMGVSASSAIHQRMLRSIFRAPLSFFSATPSGQILNRFGKELDVVDRSLPEGIASVLYCFLQIFFSTLALAGAVTPLMMIPLGLVGIQYANTMGRFRRASRDLKRAESKSRSPLYSIQKEALRGAETIRSIPSGSTLWSNKQRALADENIALIYSTNALNRWLSIKLESLGNVVVFSSAVASIFLTRAGKLQSGSAGWGLTQAMAITGLLTWAVRVLTDLETHFLSVMRVSELTDIKDLESTDTDGIEQSVAIEKSWPTTGRVQFNDVSMRYTPVTPYVLKNVSVDIPSGSTLGVVGRTGSGKSSLLLSLFRLVEIENGGSITIDGVDIGSLPVKQVRDSLSIIPQSPTLFQGTLLYNLDATGKVSAEEAWGALESVNTELARQFRESEAGLNTTISEGGGNLSLGQRQLICLARALLKRSRILVLDEATSSVDTKTDAQVQETIRREFVQKGVTVITVAHRLDTVLGYDRILVLDNGEAVEVGAPGELLKNPNGSLRRLFDANRRNQVAGAT